MAELSQSYRIRPEETNKQSFRELVTSLGGFSMANDGLLPNVCTYARPVAVQVYWTDLVSLRDIVAPLRYTARLFDPTTYAPIEFRHVRIVPICVYERCVSRWSDRQTMEKYLVLIAGTLILTMSFVYSLLL